ncbi:phospholipase C [Burkholderia lata]|nr:phospholipase C [Burkholderia lata]
MGPRPDEPLARREDAAVDGPNDAAEVPFQRALADAFTLCDHYHCGMHTGTIANRLFYWSGTNGPNGISPADGSRVKIAALNNQFNGGNDIGPSSQGWTWTTYADRLQQAAPKIVPPAVPSFPAQATGVRPSRALPYELHAGARADAGNGTVTLKFANTGRAAAVFHVYDKLHLDRLPQRYVVEPGKTLHGDWAARADNGGKYDLWVLGPNGYHRRFTGDLSRLAGARAPHPEVRVGYAGASGNLHLRLRNHGGGTVRFTVKSNQVYGPLSSRGAHDDRGHGHGNEDGNSQGHGHGTGTMRTVTVRAGDQAELHWKLDSTGHWYDFIVTADSDASFSRRVAGRVETGRHSVSDPAMGLADRF